MHKGYKKTFAILITCALIGALFCLPVSAVTVGGATIQMYDGYFWLGESNSEKLSANYVQGNGASYDANMSLINPASVTENWGSYAFFSFSSSGENYGTLTITVGSSGNIYNSASDKLYIAYADGTTGKYLDCDIIYNADKNLVTYSYFGQIPAFFCICTWARYQSSATTLVSSYYNISFQAYDIATDKIIENADDNASDIMSNADSNTSDIIDNQNQTASDIQSNADKNASDIQSNQDENTQSIIDNQNQLAEQEKQEITDSGNQATDAAESIPNESAGFISALNSLVKAMSTTSTNCSLNFPAIKIPAIAGVIPETTISTAKKVDFAAAVNLIPADILSLIQALTTIALIVFCFKELYDTISEALTRKKANSDG